MNARWRSQCVLTITVANASYDSTAQSLCAASCCTSCPPGPSAFATMGCWQAVAKASSCPQHAWLCRCLHPTLRPLRRPGRSWRGWARWIWACARAAKWAGCGLSLRWRGLGGCLGRTALWRLISAGRHDGFLPCIVQWTRFRGACRRSVPSCVLSPPRAASTT